MKAVYLLLAEGFEISEAMVTLDYLRRAGIEAYSVSVTGKRMVTSSHKITVEADKLIEEVKAENALAVVLPGGLPGSENLRDHKDVIPFILKAEQEGSIIAAICAAPIVLEKAGLLKGRRGTVYPGFQKDFSLKEYVNGVCADGKVLTGQGPAFAPEFALELVRMLRPEKVEEVRRGLLSDLMEEYIQQR